jgi:hypothetical protein
LTIEDDFEREMLFRHGQDDLYIACSMGVSSQGGPGGYSPEPPGRYTPDSYVRGSREIIIIQAGSSPGFWATPYRSVLQAARLSEQHQEDACA